jgi:hypothetical protein
MSFTRTSLNLAAMPLAFTLAANSAFACGESSEVIVFFPFLDEYIEGQLGLLMMLFFALTSLVLFAAAIRKRSRRFAWRGVGTLFCAILIFILRSLIYTFFC